MVYGMTWVVGVSMVGTGGDMGSWCKYGKDRW